MKGLKQRRTLLAGIALNLITLEDYARHVEIARTYQPDPDATPVYDELFDAYLEIYKRTSPIYKKLNRPH